jgi:hypothetical protein
VTTIEELPAGFWDDAPPSGGPPPDGGPAASDGPPPASVRSRVGANRAGQEPESGESRTTEAAARLASLTGLSLLEAVFPGRVLKVERPAVALGTDAVDDPIDEPAPDADALALFDEETLEPPRRDP